MPVARRRLIRRLVTLGAIGGLFAYRKQRLDAADQAFPQALRRSP